MSNSGGPGHTRLVMDADLRATRASDTRLDCMIGLDPDKGGDFRPTQLQEWAHVVPPAPTTPARGSG